MNASADPCEDFNEFSCGMFKKRRIPNDATSTDVFSDLRVALSLAVAGNKKINKLQTKKKHQVKLLKLNVNKDEIEKPVDSEDITATENAKLYYQSCMDEKTIEDKGEQALKDVINSQLGGWPLISLSYNPDSSTLIQKLVRLRKLNIQPLFYFYLEANPKKPSQAILRVTFCCLPSIG